MARDISIAISARDNFSSAINSMRNSGQHFNKDLEETQRQMQSLQQKQDALGGSYKKLQTNLDSTKNALQSARKEFRELDNEINRTNLENAYGEYNKAKDELRQYGVEMKRVRQNMKELSDEQNRAANRASGSGDAIVSRGIAETAETSSALNALAGAGLGKMLGDSISGAVHAGIGSAYGGSMGNAISTTLNGALSGAAMGSMAGLPGAVAGAAVGTLAGGISAVTGYLSDVDDEFKSLRNSMVEDIWKQQAADLASGNTIAMGREKSNVQMVHVFGDDEAAGGFLDRTIALANQTPFYYSDLLGVGMTYKSFGYTNDELFEEQRRVADAAAIRGWDASEMESLASTIGFMRQSGKLDTMRVKQLQMKGLNIPRYLAIANSGLTGEDGEGIEPEEFRRLMGLTEEELKNAGVSLTEDDIYALISAGKIDGKKAARAISDYMAAEFEGGAAKLAETYYGLESTLGGLREQHLSAIGEGYNEERMRGMAEQINWLSGEYGDEKQEVNRMIGEAKGRIENTHEQMQREIEKAVMTGDLSHLDMSIYYPDTEDENNSEAREDFLNSIRNLGEDFQKAFKEQDGIELERILGQAEVEVEAAFSVAEGSQSLIDSQTTMIEEASKTLARDDRTYMGGHRIGEAMGKGILDAIQEKINAIDINAMVQGGYFSNDGGFGATTNSMYDDASAGGTPGRTTTRIRSSGSSNDDDAYAPLNAWGLPYVPYDGYLTRLHEGERVLTAEEARRHGEGGVASVTVNGNFTVREEADVYKIAQALAAELKRAQMVS